MTQIATKGIADQAITNAKIANAAGIPYSKLSIADGDLTIAKTSGLQTALDNKVDDSEKGANNGVATLDAGGKVPAAQLPNSVMEYKGAWVASTNTPTLANGTGNAGDVYVASDAGTVDFGAGNITFAAGDWVIYSGSIWEKSTNSNAVASVNGQTGVVVLNTSHISENTNLYFTDARAKAAAVADSITDGVTDVAPSQNAVFDALALKIPTSYLDTDGTLAANSDSKIATQKAVKTYVDAITVTGNNEILTLNGTDITNQYKDLAQIIKPGTLVLTFAGVDQELGSDYTLSTVSSKTRITFAGDLATGGAAELISGDKLNAHYLY